MAEFYSARSATITPLPWSTFAPPFSEAAGGEYVSAISLECPAGECTYVDPAGVPFHFDYGHLTMNGARALVAAMALPARVDASGQ